MPVRPVTKNGKRCWQWGKSGKVYCGKDGHARATKQGRAAHAAGYKGGK